MSMELIDLIKILKRAENCERIFDKLQMMSTNVMFDERDRKKYYNDYPPQAWYDHIKQNIDDCIKLIEED
jgi:hypothetical protein